MENESSKHNFYWSPRDKVAFHVPEDQKPVGHAFTTWELTDVLRRGETAMAILMGAITHEDVIEMRKRVVVTVVNRIGSTFDKRFVFFVKNVAEPPEGAEHTSRAWEFYVQQ
jgi:hypothetical protein